MSQVLLLEAIYYGSVVALEVPSGYLSDRIGRRITLMAGMSAWVIACALFASTGSLGAFVLAQVLLAAGMAFNSGTDSALLYDSLDALGRQDEFAAREARAQALGSGAMAIAALIGGLLSGFDLRYAYVLSSLGALAALLCAAGFSEPRKRRLRHSPGEQWTAIQRLWTAPILRWILAYSVGMTVFNHIPYELFQPWVELFLGTSETAYSPTPATTGVLVAVMMALSALASSRAVALRERWGTLRVLLAATLLQGAVIASLAAPAHLAIIGVLALRSVPQGLSRPVLIASIHPHLPSSVRATWLSVQSLCGRMAFAITLTGASFWAAGSPMSHGLIASLAGVAAVSTLLFAGVLFATRPREFSL